jgi:hypothetical protein
VCFEPPYSPPLSLQLTLPNSAICAVLMALRYDNRTLSKRWPRYVAQRAGSWGSMGHKSCQWIRNILKSIIALPYLRSLAAICH